MNFMAHGERGEGGGVPGYHSYIETATTVYCKVAECWCVFVTEGEQ